MGRRRARKSKARATNRKRRADWYEPVTAETLACSSQAGRKEGTAPLSLDGLICSLSIWDSLGVSSQIVGSCQEMWYVSAVAASRRLEQEDCCVFKTGLGYSMSLSEKQINKQETGWLCVSSACVQSTRAGVLIPRTHVNAEWAGQ